MPHVEIVMSVFVGLQLDSLVKVTTPHLHRLMPHIPQKFIRIGSDQKPGSNRTDEVL